MMLTTGFDRAHSCRAGAIVPAGFDSPNHRGGRKPAFNGAAFFASVRSFTLWWIGRGGASLPGSFVTGLSTLFGLPPVIDSSVGRYIYHMGANIMANQQAESANKQKSSFESDQAEMQTVWL